MQDTRDNMNIVDVYHQLGFIVKTVETSRFKEIAERQFLEASDMLQIVYKLNKLLGDSWN